MSPQRKIIGIRRYIALGGREVKRGATSCILWHETPSSDFSRFRRWKLKVRHCQFWQR